MRERSDWASLTARAERLARKTSDRPEVSVRVLVFEMRRDRYGIELASLVEAVPHPRIAPVPGAPPQLAGVIQVRGEINPVWELSRLLGLADLEADDEGWVLLLRRESGKAGLRVGTVVGIRELRPEAERPGEGSPYVKWVTSDAIAILNTEKLVKEETR